MVSIEDADTRANVAFVRKEMSRKRQGNNLFHNSFHLSYIESSHLNSSFKY